MDVVGPVAHFGAEGRILRTIEIDDGGLGHPCHDVVAKGPEDVCIIVMNKMDGGIDDIDNFGSMLLKVIYKRLIIGEGLRIKPDGCFGLTRSERKGNVERHIVAAVGAKCTFTMKETRTEYIQFDAQGVEGTEGFCASRAVKAVADVVVLEHAGVESDKSDFVVSLFQSLLDKNALFGSVASFEGLVVKVIPCQVSWSPTLRCGGADDECIEVRGDVFLVEKILSFALVIECSEGSSVGIAKQAEDVHSPRHQEIEHDHEGEDAECDDEPAFTGCFGGDRDSGSQCDRTPRT